MSSTAVGKDALPTAALARLGASSGFQVLPLAEVNGSRESVKVTGVGMSTDLILRMEVDNASNGTVLSASLKVETEAPRVAIAELLAYIARQQSHHRRKEEDLQMKLSMAQGKLFKLERAKSERSTGGGRKKGGDLARYGDGASPSSPSSSPSPKRQRRGDASASAPPPPPLADDGGDEPGGDDLDSVLGCTDDA